ncbi:hypothetical protein HN51_040909 [Arachis hypogaea]|uniref:50S ribosomal protein n=1 Tax=Arachis hypogaea TaxID=3818 RepID=A0A444YQ60_ARAHY|nr:50S ribosomal protein 5, chloroplastic [Arachis hypogaea]QHN86563.1 50S ribosomal protein 5 [Arachis hypogaea]RYR04106.1 hypothetical protein Ahy_B06g083686 [Arachis hypogaea]
MALLCFNSLTLPSLHSPIPSSSLVTPVFRVQLKPPVGVPTKCLNFVPIRTTPSKRRSMVVAAAAADGASPAEGGSPPPPEGEKKESAAVDKLPLESKLKEKEEQRLRMKMAKKIRLRRKRLVRKRRLRKKGRWPPSKMKKLKNV